MHICSKKKNSKIWREKLRFGKLEASKKRKNLGTHKFKSFVCVRKLKNPGLRKDELDFTIKIKGGKEEEEEKPGI